MRDFQVHQLVDVICLLYRFLGQQEVIKHLALVVPQVGEYINRGIGGAHYLLLEHLYDDCSDEAQHQVPPERLLSLHPEGEHVGVALADVEDLLYLLTGVVGAQNLVLGDWP